MSKIRIENNHNLEDQYRHIVDATNIVSKTDTKGLITYVNDKFIEISGYTKEELIGKSHNIIRDSDNPKSMFKELWATIKVKKVWSGIISNIHKDGSKYFVKASIFPIVNDDDEIIEYISIRHDITQLKELSRKLEELYEYNISQQKIAREKVEAGIINHLLDSNKCQVFSKASDVLSGDFYSIHKRINGSIFIYMLDGQGHGVSPALSVFAISSKINQYINEVKNLEELVNKLFPSIKVFLGDEEQLSFTMIMICPKLKGITFTSGGMYPFLIKKAEGNIEKIKANNTPFMNFSPTPVVNNIPIGYWESLLVYSDGLVEEDGVDLSNYAPDIIINKPSLIGELKEKIGDKKLEDDVTIIHLKAR